MQHYCGPQRDADEVQDRPGIGENCGGGYVVNENTDEYSKLRGTMSVGPREPASYANGQQPGAGDARDDGQFG